MFSPHDTIVAISTPPGHGGIGVVRVSGPKARSIVRALLEGEPALLPRHATFARVLDWPGGDGRATDVLDQVVVTWFEAPASYTGDDVVEISAHGSPVTLARILEQAMRRGARAAAAGEFTLRAFLNGKLDLVQAEAVADLIEAVTPEQARAACEQLEGGLGRAIGQVEASLFDLQAQVEAAIDFPEHRDQGGHGGGSPPAVSAALDAVVGRIDTLLRGAERGRLLREGRHVVIVGPPNSGKSSLFNALLGCARAIVAATPGTTRDVLIERCAIGGVPITLVDTAGLRATDEPVEAEGVARAVAAGAAADLLLDVEDGSVAVEATAGPRRPADHGRNLCVQRICVTTKIDLAQGLVDDGPRVGAGPRVRVSAVTGEGLDDLRRQVVEALGGGPPRDAVTVTNARHAALLGEARAALGRARVLAGTDGGDELVAAEVRGAIDALQEITGRRSTDALLDAIFSRFCVGK
jgi:tRNA modification GTPase